VGSEPRLGGKVRIGDALSIGKQTDKVHCASQKSQLGSHLHDIWLAHVSLNVLFYNNDMELQRQFPSEAITISHRQQRAQNHLHYHNLKAFIGGEDFMLGGNERGGGEFIVSTCVVRLGPGTWGWEFRYLVSSLNLAARVRIYSAEWDLLPLHYILKFIPVSNPMVTCSA